MMSVRNQIPDMDVSKDEPREPRVVTFTEFECAPGLLASTSYNRGLEWRLTPQDTDEVVIKFSWAVVKADGTVQFAGNHSWDPALYGPALCVAPDLKCALMQFVCLSVHSLSGRHPESGRQTVSSLLVHPNLKDDVLLFNQYSQIHWDHGRLEWCDPTWMRANHSEALTASHKEHLDMLAAEDERTARNLASTRKCAKVDEMSNSHQRES
ncbi:hypothetical protein WJX73_010391 [Symbiochloris irregularis]|uniref:Uncharacterized protein n=1 Tax=Symbiochloris irregularis TaxID=706552 RepID=A0AAW1PKZ7_9CHLO